VQDEITIGEVQVVAWGVSDILDPYNNGSFANFTLHELESTSFSPKTLSLASTLD